MSSFNWYNSSFGWFGGHIAAVAAPAPQEPVKAAQPLDRPMGLVGGGAGIGFYNSLPGYVNAPPMTDNTMRAMSMHSTLAFIYANIVNPIPAASYTVEVSPDAIGRVSGAELEKRKKLIESAFRPAVAMPAIRTACRALQYGRWTQEAIYEIRDGFTVPVRFKTLRPWEGLQLFRDAKNDFAGAQFQGQYRDARYLYHHVNCPELDDVFGWSRHQNVILEWWQKLQNAVQKGKLARKASSIVPIVKGPSGQQIDDKGNKVSGLQICKNIAAALAAAEPVFMQQFIFEDEELNAQSSPDLMKFTAFDIDTVDLGDQGPALMALLADDAYEDVSMSRGWHQPERSSMEGTHGTKAEAGVHKAGGIEDSEGVFFDAVESLNNGPVKWTLLTNFGEDAVGSVYLKAAPLQDADKQFKQTLIGDLATNQITSQKVIEQIDVRGALQQSEVPLLTEDEIAKNRVEAAKATADTAQANAGANGVSAGNNATNANQKPANGNGRVKLDADATDTLARLASYMSLGSDEDIIGGMDNPTALSADDADGHWVTMDGEHVFVKGGAIEKGPAHLKGKQISDLKKSGTKLVPTPYKSEQHFNNNVAQHQDLHAPTPEAALQAAKSASENGFKSQYPNVASPTTSDGPSNVLEKNYATQKGKLVYFVDRKNVQASGNGDKVKNGWKPGRGDYAFVEHDNQPLYHLYLKRQAELAKGTATY